MALAQKLRAPRKHPLTNKNIHLNEKNELLSDLNLIRESYQACKPLLLNSRLSLKQIYTPFYAPHFEKHSTKQAAPQKT